MAMKTINTVRVSSGVRLGTERQETAKRKEQRRRELCHPTKNEMDFIEQCSAYGLNPEFYMAICAASDDAENLLYLYGFDGGMAVLLDENGIEVTVGFSAAITMLKNGLAIEAAELNEKIKEGIFDRSIRKDLKQIKSIRLSLKHRENILQEAESVYNSNMHQVTQLMHIPQNAGCVYFGKVHEFVSYRPDNIDSPYVLECLEKKPYDKTRYTFVDFNTLIESMKKFVNELPAEEAQQWMDMVDKIVPYDNGGTNLFSDADGQQTFFAF